MGAIDDIIAKRLEQQETLERGEAMPPAQDYQQGVTSDDGMTAIQKPAPNRHRRHSDVRLTDEALCLNFHDIRYGVTVSRMKATITQSKPGHVQILHGISGSVRSGELMAIMGPSGAGKTSLLDILAYRVKNHQGSVTINGKALDHKVLTSYCSYVPQQDSLWSALTVRENLLFASRLYRPSMSKDQHIKAVDEVISDLGLQGCKNVKIGNVLLKGVSGGQKRRASIGLELVSGRGLLFLDEPTSGLDAAAATQIMEHLKDLAVTNNMIIVASIHQPSTHVFYSFDKLLVLSKGRTAYLGAADRAKSFFTEVVDGPKKSMNPADWLLEITNADFTDDKDVDFLLDHWESSEKARTVEQKLLASEKALSSSQKLPRREDAVLSRIYNLILRAWLNYFRDPASYLMRLVVISGMSMFLGAVYSGLGNSQQDILDSAYLIQWGLAFNSYVNMVALPAFALERISVNKEFANGQYRIYQFVTATVLAQIPFIALMAVLATTAFYWIAGLNDSLVRYVEYCIIMFGQLFYIESLASFLATIIPDDVLALAVFGSLVSVIFVFNAFFVSVALMPVWLKWLQYVSPFKYAWEAMANIVYSGQEYEPCDEGSSVCIGTTGEDAMDFFSTGDQDIAGVNIWTHFAVIIALGLGLRLLFGIALVMQHK